MWNLENYTKVLICSRFKYSCASSALYNTHKNHIKNTQYNYEYYKLHKFYESSAEFCIFSPFINLKSDLSECSKC